MEESWSPEVQDFVIKNSRQVKEKILGITKSRGKLPKVHASRKYTDLGQMPVHLTTCFFQWEGEDCSCNKSRKHAPNMGNWKTQTGLDPGSSLQFQSWITTYCRQLIMREMAKHWTNYSQLKKSCLAYIPRAHQHFPNDWNSSVQFSVELNEYNYCGLLIQHQWQLKDDSYVQRLVACDSHIFKNNNVCDDVNVLYKGSVKSSQLKKLSNWSPVHNLTWK